MTTTTTTSSSSTRLVQQKRLLSTASASCAAALLHDKADVQIFVLPFQLINLRVKRLQHFRLLILQKPDAAFQMGVLQMGLLQRRFRGGHAFAAAAAFRSAAAAAAAFGRRFAEGRLMLRRAAVGQGRRLLSPAAATAATSFDTPASAATPLVGEGVQLMRGYRRKIVLAGGQCFHLLSDVTRLHHGLRLMTEDDDDGRMTGAALLDKFRSFWDIESYNFSRARE